MLMNLFQSVPYFTLAVLGRKGCRVSAIRRYTKTGLCVESANGYLSECHHSVNLRN